MRESIRQTRLIIGLIKNSQSLSNLAFRFVEEANDDELITYSNFLRFGDLSRKEAGHNIKFSSKEINRSEVTRHLRSLID